VANDHYIPRLLTAPWEFGERKLRFFDFCTRTFEEAPSKRLFARRGLNSVALETWLNQTIETPVADYVNQLRNGGRPSAPDWRAQRALTLLFFLNSQRIEEALRGKPASLTLEDLAASTDGLADRIAQLFLSTFKLLCAPVPLEHQLFFTEVGLFAYPMPARPVLGLPLGLNHALLAYDGPLNAKQLRQSVARNRLSLFSLGIGTDVHRVILPPLWREASDIDAVDIRQRLLDLREAAREMFNLVGVTSEKAGLIGWGAT
jgi:hypothetical protein